MELQAFEVQVCAKAEAKGLEMAFLVKVPWVIVSLFLNCFRVKQIGFEQVFDKLTYKHMYALRKQVQSLVYFVLNHCFRTCAIVSKF